MTLNPSLTMNPLIRLVPIFLLSLAFALTLGAQSASEIQERIRDRLPEVDSLKLSGIAGENNRGYLEAREEVSSEQKKLIEDENTDRKKLYQIAARRASVSLEEVEKLRAEQIRERSPRGIWLQDDTGEWYRK